MPDNRVSLSSFDGIAEASEMLLREALSTEVPTNAKDPAMAHAVVSLNLKKVEVSAKLLEQARANLEAKAKCQAALDALSPLNQGGRKAQPSAKTSDPFGASGPAGRIIPLAQKG